MRILITGATGFLGSAIAHACVASGIEVSAIRRPHSNLTRLSGIVERITFHDNTDAGVAAALNCQGGCDAVIHAATCYGRNGETNATLLETNTNFPLIILEKSLDLGTSLFINIDTVLSAQINAYALSKRQFADWGHMLCKSGMMRFVNVRLEHLFGPGDDPSRFLTYIIRQFLANAESVSLTEGSQMRDFIYINDAAAGIMQILNAKEKLPAGWSEIDLGSGQLVSIRQLVERIHHLMESNTQLCFGKIPYRANEPMKSIADISKIVELGWTCRMPLEDGLMETINFEKSKLLVDGTI